jgi:hypothetical protein
VLLTSVLMIRCSVYVLLTSVLMIRCSVYVLLTSVLMIRCSVYDKPALNSVTYKCIDDRV